MLVGNIQSLLNYVEYVPPKSFNAMFKNCTSLVTPPELPAKYICPEAYGSMFEGCTALIDVPALPAQYLSYACYEYMFNSCTSLTNLLNIKFPQSIDMTTPDILSTMIDNWDSEWNHQIYIEFTGMYRFMFTNCSNLIEIPSNFFPTQILQTIETHIAGGVYTYVFANCEKLETIGNNIIYGDCDGMFKNCVSLTQVPDEFILYPPGNGYWDDAGVSYMFAGCINLKTVPKNLFKNIDVR
jgi:hypothetical protein